MDIDTIRQQYCDELLSLDAIAKFHGAGRITITKIMKDHGWCRRGSVYSKVSKPTKEEFESDYRRMSLYALRRKYKTRDDTIDKWLCEYGIAKEPFYRRKSYLEVSDIQHEFILGSLLGDASIVRKAPQHRLSLTHNASQRAYMEHKKEILGSLALASIQDTVSAAHESRVHIRGAWHNHTIKESRGCLLHSKVHPYFTELRGRLYPDDKKTICGWWLDQVTARSLAYWIMDDGSADYSSGSYVLRISTHSYDYGEHLVLREFLGDKFGVEMRIQPTPQCGFGQIVRFRTEDSKRLRDIITPYIPDCMKYKVDREVWQAGRI